MWNKEYLLIACIHERSKDKPSPLNQKAGMIVGILVKDDSHKLWYHVCWSQYGTDQESTWLVTEK